MPTTQTEPEAIQTLNVVKRIEIDAPIGATFAAVLEEMGPGCQMPDGSAFPMVFEAWPGGRWFRDTGNNAGHLWGHVQVIKPPKLIEVTGPLFMSYPVASHLQYRLTESDGRTTIQLTHRAFGMIPEEHLAGVNEGWQFKLQRVAEIAAQR